MVWTCTKSLSLKLICVSKGWTMGDLDCQMGRKCYDGFPPPSHRRFCKSLFCTALSLILFIRYMHNTRICSQLYSFENECHCIPDWQSRPILWENSAQKCGEEAVCPSAVQTYSSVSQGRPKRFYAAHLLPVPFFWTNEFPKELDDCLRIFAILKAGQEKLDTLCNKCGDELDWSWFILLMAPFSVHTAKLIRPNIQDTRQAKLYAQPAEIQGRVRSWCMLDFSLVWSSDLCGGPAKLQGASTVWFGSVRVQI